MESLNTLQDQPHTSYYDFLSHTCDMSNSHIRRWWAFEQLKKIKNAKWVIVVWSSGVGKTSFVDIARKSPFAIGEGTNTYQDPLMIIMRRFLSREWRTEPGQETENLHLLQAHGEQLEKYWITQFKWDRDLWNKGGKPFYWFTNVEPVYNHHYLPEGLSQQNFGIFSPYNEQSKLAVFSGNNDMIREIMKQDLHLLDDYIIVRIDAGQDTREERFLARSSDLANTDPEQVAKRFADRGDDIDKFAHLIIDNSQKVDRKSDLFTTLHPQNQFDDWSQMVHNLTILKQGQISPLIISTGGSVDNDAIASAYALYELYTNMGIDCRVHLPGIENSLLSEKWKDSVLSSSQIVDKISADSKVVIVDNSDPKMINDQGIQDHQIFSIIDHRQQYKNYWKREIWSAAVFYDRGSTSGTVFDMITGNSATKKVSLNSIQLLANAHVQNTLWGITNNTTPFDKQQAKLMQSILWVSQKWIQAQLQEHELQLEQHLEYFMSSDIRRMGVWGDIFYSQCELRNGKKFLNKYRDRITALMNTMAKKTPNTSWVCTSPSVSEWCTYIMLGWNDTQWIKTFFEKTYWASFHDGLGKMPAIIQRKEIIDRYSQLSAALVA